MRALLRLRVPQLSHYVRGASRYVYIILLIFVVLYLLDYSFALGIFFTLHVYLDQVIMNPKKEYDMLKSQMADSKASYLKHSSNHMPQVNVLF